MMMQNKKLKIYNPKLKEECGVFGISNTKDASTLTALGLHALQHRGQEGCGIVSYDGKNYYSEKRLGLVGDNFNNEDTIKKLPGYYAIGDIVAGPALAHVASAEGILCIEKIAGHDVSPIDYGNIPGCTYCSPEISSVGLTEKQALEKGYKIKVKRELKNMDE